MLTFSVILPVCHGGACLDDSLASLRKLSTPADSFEVIVAGAAENAEAKRSVLEESECAPYQMTYIECPGIRRSRLLNSACRVARGRYLVFADDDCLFRPDWLERFYAALSESSDVGIVGGTDVLAEKGRTPFALALDIVLNSFAGTGGFRKGDGLGAGAYCPKLWNMAIPREVALSVAIDGQRVFDESLLVHEDVELTERIRRSGKRVVCAPDVQVDHRRETTFLSFAHRNFRMAAASRRIGIHRLPHTLLALLMVTLFAGAAFYRVLPEPARGVLVALLGMYLLLLLGAAWKGIKRTRSIQVALLVPCLALTLHLARTAGYLWPLGATKDAES